MSSMSLYFLIIGKLHWTFRETTYRLSRKYISFLMLLLMIQFGLMIWYDICIHNVSADQFLKLSLRIVTAIIAVDFTIDIGVLALFIYKLQQLLVNSVDLENVHRYTTGLVSGNVSSDNVPSENPGIKKTLSFADRLTVDYSFGRNQRKLIVLITKQSVLGTWIIMFNCTFYFKILLDRFLVSDGFPADVAFQFSYCLRAVENVVIICMLYLTFAFSEKLYLKVCGCCDASCHNCCARMTDRQITKRQTIISMDDYQQM